jgi:hypothetical protein
LADHRAAVAHQFDDLAQQHEASSLMHVRYSSHLIWVFVGAGILWVGILLALIMSDYVTRGWLPVSGW